MQGLILVLVQGAAHAGGTLGLHAVDLDVRFEALDRKSHTRDQAASAHRDNDSVHIRQLVEDLQADGPLSCDHLLVIVGVDKGHARLRLQLHGLIMGIIVGARHQADLCTEVLGVFHFHDGGTIRHTDNALDAPAGGCQRHALGVVARRAGNHAFFALFLGELADFIVGTAHLEAACSLQVFGFEVELAVFRQLGCLDEVGLACNVLKNKGGVVDLIQSQHDNYFLSCFCKISCDRK